jgi:WXXGXW repeat (2 copies)
MKLRSFAFVALLLAALPASSSRAAVFFSANFAPPPLPVVYQPPCPVDGYLWNPGYWAYGSYGYYWVPGFWTAPPAFGLLWTPPWWGFSNGIYAFHRGYWGPRVGFYGGINYGYGYFGNGFYGGEWAGNVFRYNTAVTRVNTTVIKNVYINKTVVRNQTSAGRTSFNGGPKGVKAVATAQEKAAAAQRRSFATSQQAARQERASKNLDLRASVNKGRPKEAAINSVRENATQPGKAKPATATATAGKPVNNQVATPKLEPAAKKENAARNEAAVQKQEQARTAVRQREEATRNAEKRQAELRAREIRERETSAARQRQDAVRNAEKRNAEVRARERETVLARRRMAERSRRPEAVAPRDANSRGDNASEQRKRKKRNQEESDDRH